MQEDLNIEHTLIYELETALKFGHLLEICHSYDIFIRYLHFVKPC